MESPKILLVEDDPNLGTILNEYLNAKNFISTLCKDGKEGYETFLQQDFDICILDVMMPIKDGFTLAKEIRRVNHEIPIIFLTAKAMKEDKVEGFKLGGDDYLTKPFSMEELLLRVQAILKRTHMVTKEKQKEEFDFGQFHFDYRNQTLTIESDEQRLTSKENDLLRLLCVNLNDVLERSIALKKIWGDDSYFNSRSMDVYVTKLRKYLKKDEKVQLINVHGKGFKLVVND